MATGAPVLAALLLALVAAPPATAETYTESVLHSFAGSPDGAIPVGTIVFDGDGNLYGTTLTGGSTACYSFYNVPGCGTAFRLTHRPDGTWQERVVRSFARSRNGELPFAGLLPDANGNLFGTTHNGGVNCVKNSGGCGTVFELAHPLGGKWQETRLYEFLGGSDGSFPLGGLVEDGSGSFYGTTDHGGAANDGTVFQLNADGSEFVLHAFTGGADGGNPQAGLIRDAAGTLYGTTLAGGAGNNGTLFELTTRGKLKTLYSFDWAASGGSTAGVIMDAAGNIYGTFCGCAGNNDGPPKGNANGTAWQFAPSGNLTVLHRFRGGTDGGNPFSGVIMDRNGNLYGTTEHGGAYENGTVYKLSQRPDSTWKESVLYSFTGGADGGNPYSGLILDDKDNLYGTTAHGGDSNCNDGSQTPCGVVFQLAVSR